MTQKNSALGGQWARQQQEGMQRQEKQATDNEARRVVEGGDADQRSNQQEGGKARSGGAGDPQTSKLEPEKQGGIGGP